MYIHYVLGLKVEHDENNIRSITLDNFQSALDEFKTEKYDYMLRVIHFDGSHISSRWNGEKFI